MRKCLRSEIYFEISALLSGILIVTYFSYGFSQRPPAWRALLPPPSNLEHFNFGYRETIADGLWLRLIQDFDYCDADLESQVVTHVRSDHRIEKVLPRCSTAKGWVYQMLDVISSLTPRFYPPYRQGAALLSVIVHDDVGAELLFKRALEQFPNDWNLLYFAAYHEMSNMKNKEKAAQYFLRAGKNGAPAWVVARAAKLYSEAGENEFAISVLKNELDANPNGPLSLRLRIRLDELLGHKHGDEPEPATE